MYIFINIMTLKCLVKSYCIRIKKNHLKLVDCNVPITRRIDIHEIVFLLFYFIENITIFSVYIYLYKFYEKVLWNKKLKTYEKMYQMFDQYF